MDVATLAMPRELIEEEYQKYNAVAREKMDAEAKAVLRAYRAIRGSKGLFVIDAIDAIIKAGVNDEGLPKLALCRADLKHVWYRWEQGGPEFRFKERLRSHYHTASYLRLPAESLPAPKSNQWRTYKAVVPMIPAYLKPPHKLDGYHILWEAEWKGVPVDPYLLKHIHGHLYLVLAEWDLTPIEQAVLKERL